jgi:hypothetical protein
MSLADAFIGSEDAYKGAVMAATWGHLEPKRGEIHKGTFTFIHGQHGDEDVIESNFPTMPGEGPLYFDVRSSFIFDVIQKKDLDVGVYEFVGVYRVFKNGNTRFTGDIYSTKLVRNAKMPNKRK